MPRHLKAHSFSELLLLVSFLSLVVVSSGAPLNTTPRSSSLNLFGTLSKRDYTLHCFDDIPSLGWQNVHGYTVTSFNSMLDLCRETGCTCETIFDCQGFENLSLYLAFKDECEDSCWCQDPEGNKENAGGWLRVPGEDEDTSGALADLTNLMGCLGGWGAGLCLGEGHCCEGYKCVMKTVLSAAVLFGTKTIVDVGSCLVK